MCLPASVYTSEQLSETANLEVIARAHELGVNMLDTADIYGVGASERLLAKAMAGGNRDKFVIATKFAYAFGPIKTEAEPYGAIELHGDPEYVKQACEKSLQNLGIDTIDLYYQHRVDPSTPIEETVKAMAELVKEGKVRHLGLSEVSPAELRRAHAVHPISAVQLEWSLWERSAERDIIPACRELGVGIVAYSPLGRGFLTGQIKSRADLPNGDWRASLPRFSEENFAKNLELVKKVEEIAARKGATSSQIALGWLHAQGEDVFPIPGTRKISRLEENVGGFGVELSETDLAEIDAAFPDDIALGDRYPEGMMEHLHDSRKV